MKEALIKYAEENHVGQQLFDLPCTIKGFVVRTIEGDTVVLNSRCSHEQNEATYLHELEHLHNEDFCCHDSADEIEYRAHKKEGKES